MTENISHEPELDTNRLDERMEQLLRKYGYHPEDTPAEQLRTRPSPHVVGEMLRQFVCLIAEYEAGCPNLEMCGYTSTIGFIDAWMQDFCHAPGLLIGGFLSGPAGMKEKFPALLLFAEMNGMGLPRRIIEHVSQQIVGWESQSAIQHGGE
jgi:hypothetical protein